MSFEFHRQIIFSTDVILNRGMKCDQHDQQVIFSHRELIICQKLV